MTRAPLYDGRSIAPQSLARARVPSVDLLRGLLMVLMALDHTRDYFSSVRIDPTDPLHSWPALFLTRWLSHICAPGFIALAGISVYLQRQRGKPKNEVIKLLATRGLWLVFLDVTLISFAWSFTFRYPFMNIISTIGICMVGLAALQWLPIQAVGVFGAAIIAFHNLLDSIHASQLNHSRDLWILLHELGFMTWKGHPFAMVYFPVLAWFGIMCLGYAFGPVVALPYPRRIRTILTLSAIFIAIFVTLRALNAYGDSYRFKHLATPAQSAMSFLELQKYPPSLEYTLATLGLLLALFGLFDFAIERNWVPRLRSSVEVYGRVPFLFYVVHIFVIHTASLVATYFAHGDWRFWIGPGCTWGDGAPEHWGYSLPIVYAVWLAVLLALFPLCKWFGHVKARRRDWWLTYL